MEILTEFEVKTVKEIISFTQDRLKDLHGSKIYGCDLHNEIFNTDYYIIGTWQAEQWLIKHTGVFNGIGIIQEYEKEQFGEVNTDLSNPEHIVNMLVYIIGEGILQQSPRLTAKWDKHLTDRDLDIISNQIGKICS